MNTPRFDYSEAFSRNIGWVTEAEQAVLKSKRVAIAGLGGVGGVHLTTLSRLGIGAFHIADADHFELANFNRQAGATVSTLGQSKLDVMTRMARDINPEIDIKDFSEGIHEGNIEAFLDGVDIYVDALDFLCSISAARFLPNVTGAAFPPSPQAPSAQVRPILFFARRV